MSFEYSAFALNTLYVRYVFRDFPKIVVFIIGLFLITWTKPNAQLTEYWDPF